MLFDSWYHLSAESQDRYVSRLKGFHHRPVSLVLVLIVLATLIFSVWATQAPIDEVARSAGEVIASSRVQVIQAVDGGVLAEMGVREGDRVSSGQVLARLDDTRFGASVKEIEARLSALQAKAARLRAEITANPTLEFPEHLQDFPEQIRVERALFVQRREGLQQELRVLREAKRLAKEELSLLRGLARSGDANRAETIRGERALNEAQSKLVVRQNRFLEDASRELTQAENEIAQNEQILTQRRRQLQDSVFVAPLDGVVKNVRVTTVGGVLRPGEELLQIIPVDDVLVVESKISPADIARVRAGLPATLRFDPFDYTIYGSVEGEVVYVSADTLKEERRGGEEIYYRAHVAIAANPVLTSIGRSLEIQPGMTAQVDIRTGTRTLMSYLLKPLRKTLSESLGER